MYPVLDCFYVKIQANPFNGVNDMKKGCSIIITSFLAILTCKAHPLVTFYLYPYPHAQDYANKISRSFRKPGKIAKRRLEGAYADNRVGGIFATYFGYLQVSSASGQVSFPRKKSVSSVKMLVTSKIEPIIMHTNTVSHWELVPGSAASLYEYVLQEDQSTGKSLWHVKQMPLPSNDHISPQETIIVIAKPTNVYIPIGATLAKKDPNLILPPLFVKKGISHSRNALYILNLAHYFKPAELLYKRGKERYNTLIRE